MHTAKFETRPTFMWPTARAWPHQAVLTPRWPT